MDGGRPEMRASGSPSPGPLASDPSPSDPLLAAPAQAAVLLADGLGSTCLSPTLTQVQAGFTSAARLSNITAAVRLRLIRELLDRQVSARHPRAAVRAWMVRECGIGDGLARREIAAALATGPTGPLPLVGQALAAGQISREHVDVAVTALGSIPARVIAACGPQIDTALTEWSRTWTPPELKTLAAQLVATLCPADADDAAAETFERRSASLGVDGSGMVHVQAHLDAAGGAIVTAVLEELAGPASGRSPAKGEGDEGGGAGEGAADRDGHDAPAHDDREREVRLADALVEMARLAQVGMSSERPTAEPTRLVVVSTIEQLAHPVDDPHAGEPGSDEPEPTRPEEQHRPEHQPGPAAQPDPAAQLRPVGQPSQSAQPEHATQLPPVGQPSQSAQPRQGDLPMGCAAPGLATALGVGPIAPSTLHRLACDSVVDHVLLDRRGAVVAMETLGRFATPAQARALAARDGGCARPGCGAPPARCDVHHVTFWSRGGRTRVSDMVLLCGPDHTLIHQEEWRIVMDGGVPWFIPPPWIDPDQTPIRNTLRTAIATAQRLGQRLRQPPRAA